jgi:hypothetical protein
VTEDVESVPKLVAKENRWSRAGRVDREDFHHAQPRAIVRIDADTRPRPAPMFNSSEPALGFPPHAPASTTTARRLGIAITPFSDPRQSFPLTTAAFLTFFL